MWARRRALFALLTSGIICDEAARHVYSRFFFFRNILSILTVLEQFWAPFTSFLCAAYLASAWIAMKIFVYAEKQEHKLRPRAKGFTSDGKRNFDDKILLSWEREEERDDEAPLRLNQFRIKMAKMK